MGVQNIMLHSPDDNHYDNHTLYAEIDDATYEQVLFVIQSVIDQLNVKCEHHINMVESRNGFRCAYIYLSNVQVYHAIMGKNLDGTDRISFFDDPEFVMPEESYDEALKTYHSKTIDVGFSWADDIDDYDEIISRYRCPQIKVCEDSLVKIPNYKKNSSFALDCAYVKSVPKNYKNNILIGLNIPTWTTIEDLNNHFEKFDTSRNNTLSKSYSILDNKKYPIITIKRNKRLANARVIFSENTNDAHFALLFSKYVVLTSKKKEKSFPFKFWYLKDKFYTGSQ